MRNLIHNSLLLVGDEETKCYFKNYFREIFLVKNNSEALSICKKKYFPIIFILNSIDTAKEIRDYHKDAIIAVIVDKIDKENLLKGFFIHIIGYIERPFQKNKVEEVLFYIDREIEHLNPNIVWLKNNYSFDFNREILYDSNHIEIKLTKKERQFLETLVKSKQQFVSNSILEYTIWEEESLSKDCSGRLKALINSIRKKLPPKSIVNEYSRGYKITVK